MPAAQDVSRTERRKYPRKDVIGAQLVSVDVKPQTSNALLLDISENGFALQNLKAMKPGGTREVAFRLTDIDKTVELSALVVWKDGDRAGLRLVRISESARPVLQRWMATLPDVPLNGRGPKPKASSETTTPRPSRTVPIAPPQELRDEEFYSIVARARVLTCATGAAIAWQDADGMVCRASTGLAPEPGARVQTNQGLSGECIRTAAVVVCGDTENDRRVDPEVCRQLKLRSLVIVPVLRRGKVVGLIEVFSSKPHAFRDQDVEGLQVLAQQCSGERSVSGESGDVDLQGFTAASEPRSPWTFKYRVFLPWIIGGAVLLGGAGLALRRSTPASASGPDAAPSSRADLAATPDGTSSIRPAGIPREVTEAFFGKGDAAARSVIRKGRSKNSGSSKATSGARNSDKRQTSGNDDAGASPAADSSADQQPTLSPAATPAESPPPGPDVAPPALSSDTYRPESNQMAALGMSRPAVPSGPVPTARGPSEVTPARLVHSVKPQYPESARAKNQEGTVVLHMKIGADGRARNINVVEGDPDFAHAAVVAVRQWRYEPYKLAGKPVEGETNVTVKFALNHTR